MNLWLNYILFSLLCFKRYHVSFFVVGRKWKKRKNRKRREMQIIHLFCAHESEFVIKIEVQIKMIYYFIRKFIVMYAVCHELCVRPWLDFRDCCLDSYPDSLSLSSHPWNEVKGTVPCTLSSCSMMCVMWCVPPNTWPIVNIQ